MNLAVGPDLVRLVLTRRGRAWRGAAGSCWARPGLARQGCIGGSSVPADANSQCLTRSGVLLRWTGTARQCKARSGAARLVVARLGSVGHGRERRGDVCRHAYFR